MMSLSSMPAKSEGESSLEGGDILQGITCVLCLCRVFAVHQTSHKYRENSQTNRLVGGLDQTHR